VDGVPCRHAGRRLRTLRRRAAEQTIVVELDEAEWEAITAREHRLVVLESALASVSGADLGPSLVRVAKALPLAASVETVGIRLLARDTSRLHLLAHEGLPSRSVRDLALDPIPVATQRSIFSLGGHHSLARSLGLRYLGGEWLQTDSDLIGSLTVGSGTDRRPSTPERELIRETAASLAESLKDVDRDEERLRALSLAMARAAILEPPDMPEARLAALRPREATVLELYADGRSVDEIASLLVISPHTVRTHIKLAFRRLGIHSREEAAELVLTDELAALL
jgi:DNA-binding CsgD family transcriptional regulator